MLRATTELARRTRPRRSPYASMVPELEPGSGRRPQLETRVGGGGDGPAVRRAGPGRRCGVAAEPGHLVGERLRYHLEGVGPEGEAGRFYAALPGAVRLARSPLRQPRAADGPVRGSGPARQTPGQ